MHFREKYSLRELQDADRADFTEWYRSATPAISAIERQVHYELGGFADQLQSHQLVKLTIRRKSESSFVDKIEQTLADKKELKKLEKRFGTRKIIGPEELVKDLIGARFIMYAGPDQMLPIQFLSFRQEFDVNELRIYSIYDEGSPFFHKQYKQAIERLFPNTPTKVGQKASGYESIHAIVRLKPVYVGMRSQQYIDPVQHARKDRYEQIDHSDADNLRTVTNDAWATLARLELSSLPGRATKQRFVNSIQRRTTATLEKELDLLDKIEFEVQIRTALQDNWAQIEHRLRYSIDKQSPSLDVNARSESNRELIDHAFKAQTVMTSALERNQLLVLHIDGQKYDQALLTIRALSAGKRGQFFDDDKDAKPIFERVNQIYAGIDDELQKVKPEPSVLNKLTPDLLNEAEALGRKSQVDFRTFTADDDAVKWGKRRYILLMLGYLLLLGTNSTRTQIIDWFTKGSPK